MSDQSDAIFEQTFPRAEPVRLEALVDYGTAAIISRTLARSPGGNLTLFAFDRGQELSEHTAPFDALVQVLDGRAELTIGGRPVVAEAGQSVLMPANVPHAVKAVEPMKMLLVMIRLPRQG
jgi:quercetin dioxygenase-like cupin family protein